jgi:Zn-dependent M28 family amino/carboxypeptidase
MRLAAVLFVMSSFACFADVSYADTKLESRIRSHVEILASDEFEGREPGTDGERKTTKYIAEAWRLAKLAPAGSRNNWFAPVNLIERSIASSSFNFYQNGHRMNFASDDIVLIGRDAKYQIEALPVMFAGYGAIADNSKVKGKLALMLAGLPDNNGGARTTEQRVEMLINAGAEAVILVADGDAGSWAATRRRFMSKKVSLQSSDNKAQLQGAVSTEFAVALVTSAKKDWDGLRKAAAKPDYAGEDLGITADFDVTTNVNRFVSDNVIGKIPGRKKNSGAVVFMAHWDHLGICRPEGEADRICNGAIDNASGIAVLTEVARALAKKRHDRDIYFVATTAEETGLLGAYSFAANPPIPLVQIVAAMNVDTIAVAPAGAKAAIIGRGTTNLDAAIERVAAKLGIQVEPSGQANSFLKRQDGWALSQKGVPAVMVNSSFSDLPFLEKYLGGDYHGPEDELTDATDLSGTAQDTELHIELGKYFANVRSFAGNKTGS